MTLRRILGAAIFMLAGSASAWAQCSNCGGYHGGVPSSSSMKKEAERKSADLDDMMKRFQEQEESSRREYQNAAAARIAEIKAQQAAAAAAIAATRREEILNRKSAEAMAKIEESRKPGAKPLEAQDRGAAVGQVKALIGVEAARERMRLNDTNKALEQLKRKEANDRPVPKSIEQVPGGAILGSLVTPFERAKERLGNLFDGEQAFDPSKE